MPAPLRPPSPLPAARARLRLYLLLPLLLAACASPRMEIVQRLEPPADPAGQACARGCAATLQTCQADCAQRRTACLADLKPEQERAWEAALKRYEAALDSWRLDLQAYEFQLWAGWHHGPWWYGPAWRYPLVGPGMTPPAPARPDRAQVDAAVARDKCDPDCGCQPPYEACVLGCGGRRISETRCLAHCPTP